MPAVRDVVTRGRWSQRETGTRSFRDKLHYQLVDSFSCCSFRIISGKTPGKKFWSAHKIKLSAAFRWRCEQTFSLIYLWNLWNDVSVFVSVWQTWRLQAALPHTHTHFLLFHLPLPSPGSPAVREWTLPSQRYRHAVGVCPHAVLKTASWARRIAEFSRSTEERTILQLEKLKLNLHTSALMYVYVITSQSIAASPETKQQVVLEI